MRTSAPMNEREPTLDEEIASLGDDDVMDFVNLLSEDTGIAGFVRLDTELGARGPRVKYFAKLGRREPSFSVSISPEPEVLASSLPERVTDSMAPLVIAWVKSNRAALLKFWNEGAYWPHTEVSAFAGKLKKLPHE
jgi:hypothetical protein